MAKSGDPSDCPEQRVEEGALLSMLPPQAAAAPPRKDPAQSINDAKAETQWAFAEDTCFTEHDPDLHPEKSGSMNIPSHVNAAHQKPIYENQREDLLGWMSARCSRPRRRGTALAQCPRLPPFCIQREDTDRAGGPWGLGGQDKGDSAWPQWLGPHLLVPPSLVLTLCPQLLLSFPLSHHSTILPQTQE